MSTSNAKLVRHLYRSFLRGARRVAQAPTPFLQLQDPPSKALYGQLHTITLERDEQLLEKHLPAYLPARPESTAVTAQMLKDMVKQNFRQLSTMSPTTSSTNEKPSFNQVLDDSLRLLRLLHEQLALFECTSITDTEGVRVICSSIPAVDITIPAAAAMSNKSFPFFYQIRIENHGKDTIQLRSRYWVIKDATGQQVDMVPHGSPGVVGQQPMLAPGQVISYVSSAVLPTPEGSMEGSYQMVRLDGEPFDALINPFRLKS